MGKKRAPSARRSVVDDLRRRRNRADRRRTLTIVGVCAIAAVVLVGLAAYRPIRDSLEISGYASDRLQDIGQSPAAAKCTRVTERRTTGDTAAPPAFGPHRDIADHAAAPMSRKFYTAEDRPALAALEHNLQRGYTILWYDDAVAADSHAMNQIRAISDKFPGTTDYRYKFIAAPWTADTPFPAGAHVALTHWSAGGTGESATSKQRGVYEYCARVSGQAVKTFMKAYPYTDSPEPGSP